MQQIVVIGAGGFGIETAFLIEEINRAESQWDLLGFLDEDTGKHGRRFNGYSVLGNLDWCKDNPKVAVACGIGNPLARKRIRDILRQSGVQFPNLIHPGVICYSGNVFGVGNIVNPGNILNVNVSIGNHVCLESASLIGHEVIIEDLVSIMPGVKVSGNVVLEEGCYLGTGCTIIQGKHIGRWATVGAGAVVIENVPPYSTVVGVPAKIIKNQS
ncbi:MAG: acetyltransferase [bacterium]